MSEGKVYEMLWDCQFCGTKQNLGLTHRFCPNCSSPQNPDSRYYPSDEEKVAVHDHQFVGVDVTCPACNELNSAAAEFCGQCASPLTEGARAKTLDPEWQSAQEAFSSSGSRDVVKEEFDLEMQSLGLQDDPKKKRESKSNIKVFAIIGLVLLLAAAAFAAFNLKKDVTVIVTDHEWERTISIDEYDEFSTRSWRDSSPSGDSVRMVSGSCRQEQRSTRRVADGETCQSVRSDNGDGTFSQRQQCTTDYRDEPVYDDMCTWEGFRWEHDRNETTSGGLSDSPYWKNVSLNCEDSRRVGCERESGRSEQYTVFYEDTDSDADYTCDYTQDVWEDISVESLWSGKARALIPGSLLCETLQEN